MVSESFYELKIDKNGDSASFKVKVKKCLDSWDNTGKLVCNDCQGKVKQLYRCDDCQTEATIGQLKNRKYEIADKELIYEEAERQAFISQKVEKTIIVKPYDLKDFWVYTTLIGGKTWELYNNDNTAIVKALHTKLLNEQKVLLGVMGFKSRYSTIVPIAIIPYKDRIMVKELLDISTLRTGIQKDLDEVKTGLDEVMEKVCVNRLEKLKSDYINSKLKGEKIDVKPKVSKEIEENKEKAIAVINGL